MVLARSLPSRGWLFVMLSVALMTLGSAAAYPAEPGKFWVFVGTYTDGKSKGIYRMVFDSASGKLSEPTLAAEVSNPSFLAVHPTRKYLYSVNESRGPAKGGGVTSFALDPKTGELTKLNQESTVGDGPCHLVVDATGKNVLVANYGGGSVAVLPIGPDGKLGPASDFIQHTGKVFDPRRQGTPHAHSVNLDKANRFAVVADLGRDRLYVYKLDPTRGQLTPNDPPWTKVTNRSGPRHFAFHPDGKHAYVINEIDCTVSAFDYDAERGTLTAIQTIPTMPVNVQGRHSTAEVVVHPSGGVSSTAPIAGHATAWAVYTIEPGTGRSSERRRYEPTRGKTRNFAVDPDRVVRAGREYVGSGTIVVFKVDPEDGCGSSRRAKTEWLRYRRRVA